MWNEYMEWEDGDDPITFYDDYDFSRIEEGRDPQWEDSQPPIKREAHDRSESRDNESNGSLQYNKALGVALLPVALGLGAIGYVLGTYVIAPAIKKVTSKSEEKAQSEKTTEWERAKNKKKITNETAAK